MVVVGGGAVFITFALFIATTLGDNTPAAPMTAIYSTPTAGTDRAPATCTPTETGAVDKGAGIQLYDPSITPLLEDSVPSRSPSSYEAWPLRDLVFHFLWDYDF